MKYFINLSLKTKTVILCAVILLAGGGYTYVNGYFSVLTSKDTTCQKAVTRWEKANPQMTTARELFKGVPAPIDFKTTSFTKAKDFKTAIIEAVNDGPNLAGKYVVAQWSCGTSCQEHAVVDMESGTIIAYGIPSEAGISMSEKYAVLITNPRENLPSVKDFKKANPASQAYLLNIPREYYVLLENGTSTTFTRICTENPFEGVEI